MADGSRRQAAGLQGPATKLIVTTMCQVLHLVSHANFVKKSIFYGANLSAGEPRSHLRPAASSSQGKVSAK